VTTSPPEILVMCSRHRKRCGLAGTRIAHADGGYCDSQVFTVTKRQQVGPETAQAVLAREQSGAAAAGETP
jgi:hypothetical protein